MEKEIPFRSMAAKWPSSVVARSEVSAFTGGLMSEKYIANLDSAGFGPAGRFRSGKKIAYPVAELIAWLEARSSVIPERRSEDYEPGRAPGQRRTE